ncbi:MAG TPA: hypothetical protein VNN15_02635 [Solirubrobacterales bacterium]|nr:hypothetical protein [Solirubrobacterales bacterium]
MEISSLRQDFGERLLDFVWGQWAQMGLLASTPRRDAWAADPEALLLLTFEVAREDPRLFDEVLDWLLVNERWISLQRLRNLAVDDEDRALAGAAADWLSSWRRKSPPPPQPEAAPEADARPLFFNAMPVEQPDPAFFAHGFLKSWTEPARRSSSPDLLAPINFAFRLRSLLGVGARAEVVRTLLTVEAPEMSLQAIALSSGFAKRNVQEAANALRAGGFASSRMIGNEQQFKMPREPWLALLELKRLPLHEDWPQLFRAFRLLLRWLRDPRNEELSDYMRASEARVVLERVFDDLNFAGVPVSTAGPSGEEYWSHFTSVVGGLPLGLRPSAPPQG